MARPRMDDVLLEALGSKVVETMNKGIEAEQIPEVRAMGAKYMGLVKKMCAPNDTAVVGLIFGVPWFFKSKHHLMMAGYIPSFLSADSDDSIQEQLDAAYVTGWRPTKADVRLDEETWMLHFSNDPPLHPVGACALNGSILVLYEHAWVLVMDTDGDWEVCRMD